MALMKWKYTLRPTKRLCFKGQHSMVGQKTCFVAILLSAILLIISIQIEPQMCDPLKLAETPLDESSSTAKLQPDQHDAMSHSRLVNGSANSVTSGSDIVSQKKSIAAKKVDHLFKETAKNYPESKIDELLEQTPSELKDLFNVAHTELDKRLNVAERKKLLSNDAGFDYSRPREDSFCLAVIKHVYPRQAKRGNLSVYVVNNDKFKQIIKAEVCLDPDTECKYLQNKLPRGTISTCHQKYSYKKLLYFDESEDRIASGLFGYPSCCACRLLQVPLTDMSADLPQQLDSLAHHDGKQLTKATDDSIIKNSEQALPDKLSKSKLENEEMVSIPLKHSVSRDELGSSFGGKAGGFLSFPSSLVAKHQQDLRPNQGGTIVVYRNKVVYI